MTQRPLALAPEDLPEEFSAYEGEVRQLSVGEVGKSGELRLEFEADPLSGRTVASEVFSRVPLQVQKALYLDSTGIAYAYIMSPSGGVLQGDRLRIEVRVGRGARAHLTTQAATKVYGMERNYATQEVDVVVEERGYLEFVPDQLIPYKGSRFHQSVRMRVHDGATMVYSEVVTPGRTGRGERFDYDVCSLKTVGLDQDSAVRFRDAVFLEPKRYSPLRVLEPERPVFASVYVVTSLEAQALADAVHAILDRSRVRGGVSVLPGRDGVFARMAAATSDELKDAIGRVVAEVRRGVLGERFVGTRKY